MRRTRFDDWPCPIARTTDLIGDWWTPLVMREAFRGVRRFDEFAESLDIPRAVLTARLDRLVEEGMLEQGRVPAAPVRATSTGSPTRVATSGDVLAAMWRWGSDWLFDDAAQEAGS